jgi:hypothetical protein
MNSIEAGILGVQLTLVGLFFVVLYESVYPFPLIGFLLGAVGTGVVFSALFSQTWE